MIAKVCAYCRRTFAVYPSSEHGGGGRYCSKRCADADRRIDPISTFWSLVDKSGGPDACWPWTGYIIQRGYGRFRHRVLSERAAHRIAYALTFGPIPDGLCVCHSCDNPPCCNPAHLFAGTKVDNARDMIRKGRNAPSFFVAHPEFVPRGERHPHAKLTKSDVLTIRKAYANGARQTHLARRYGVSQAAISLIVLCKNWRHI